MQAIAKVKRHFSENKRTYIVGGTCAFLAGFTGYVMRGVLSHIVSAVSSHDRQPYLQMTGKSDVVHNVMSGKHNVMNNVSYFSANRQGPPSWVVRCLETNDVFTSQNAAAETLGLSRAELSRHLNGLKDSVDGYTFERLCLAA